MTCIKHWLYFGDGSGKRITCGQLSFELL